MSLWSRVANAVRGERLNREIDEEFESHVEDAIAAGRDPEEARRAFGSASRAREASHAVRASARIEDLVQDARFGVRILIKNPGFTAVVVLTLALGIGINTAIFSVVNGVLLNPLPFPHPEQLVALHESKPNFANGSISYPNFLDWRKDNHTFAAMGLARGYGFSMTGRGDAVQLSAEFLSDGYFAVLGVRPVLGREFTSADETPGASPVAMISEALWRNRFGGAQDVLGQTITLDGKNFTIVGIIPASLQLQVSNCQDSDVYAPISQWSNPNLMRRGAGLAFHGIGRLKPGVRRATIAASRSALGCSTTR